MNSSTIEAPILEPSSTESLPLCVDLDGTLIRTDLFWESFVLLLRQNPWAIFLAPVWLLRGRAFLKRQVASRVSIEIDNLPFRRDVVEFVRQTHASGSKVLLVTAADQMLADKVAAHLGGFDSVHGSDGTVNLKGRQKAAFLTGLLGKRNFDYVGDSRSDLPVWKTAHGAYVAGSQRLANRAARNTRVLRCFAESGPSLLTWLRSIRLLHWTKNLLVLLPILLAHTFDWPVWRAALAGFFLFGGCASGLYILNDILDLHSDRLHPSKSKRPLAAGQVPLSFALIGSTLLVVSSVIAGFFLDLHFALTLLAYAALTVAYTWKLKKLVLIDVFVLSSFYTLRIWAGGFIAAIPISEWLTGFSLFFFLSLAMAKRHSELQRAARFVEGGNSGRGYVVQDRELLSMIGIASSFAAVVILCLYARSAEVGALYSNPAQLLWLCPLVLYWLSRIWLLAGRGELDHDPVMFAVRDRTSWVLGALAIAILVVGGFHPR